MTVKHKIAIGSGTRSVFLSKLNQVYIGDEDVEWGHIKDSVLIATTRTGCLGVIDALREMADYMEGGES